MTTITEYPHLSDLSYEQKAEVVEATMKSFVRPVRKGQGKLFKIANTYGYWEDLDGYPDPQNVPVDYWEDVDPEHILSEKEMETELAKLIRETGQSIAKDALVELPAHVKVAGIDWTSQIASFTATIEGWVERVANKWFLQDTPVLVYEDPAINQVWMQMEFLEYEMEIWLYQLLGLNIEDVIYRPLRDREH